MSNVEQPEKTQTKNAPMVVTDMPPQMGGVRAAQLGLELKCLEVTVESESDDRGLLGLDDGVSAGLRPHPVSPFLSRRREPVGQ